MSGANDTAQSKIPQHYLDRRAMPQSAFAADGSLVQIGEDPRLPGLYRDYLDDACDHPATVVVERVNSAGGKFYSRYCHHCAVKFPGHVAHAVAESKGVAVELTEAIMDARAEEYLEKRQAQFDKIVTAAAERAVEAREQAREEWRKGYDDYLRSPQWKRKAAKIMERAAGTCEGCLSRPAEEVHHLTYEHVYSEFAFELVALCAPCHRRVHGKEVA